MGVIHELVETVSPDTVYDAVYYFFLQQLPHL